MAANSDNTTTLSTLDLSTLVPGTGTTGSVSELKLATQLRTACENDGFFYLINHGVDPALIAQTFAESKQFFALTSEEKRKSLAIKSRGYTPLAEETLDPDNQSRGDTKEGYYIGTREERGATHDAAPDTTQHTAPEAQKEDTSTAIGCNVWPSTDVCPAFKITMQTYFKAVHHLGMRILRVLALSLSLDANYFDTSFDDPMEALRLLHYSEEKSNVDGGVVGCGAHSDYGMLTFLLTDHVPGLEVLARTEEEDGHGTTTWWRVAPSPGNFIVNLGDMLERWTNDTYRSTVHRVVNRTGEERYSIPFFFEPNFDTVVECLPSFCVARPAKYLPTTSGAHLLSKYAATHALFDEEGGGERKEEDVLSE
jgi:isopenicillin N synthase-like dioxygenase